MEEDLATDNTDKKKIYLRDTESTEKNLNHKDTKNTKKKEDLATVSLVTPRK